MIVQDKIITALTPGSPFNIHNRIWRSLQSLAGYTGMEPEQVLDVLLGDLATQVAVKPGKKGSMMAALKSNALQAVPEPDPTVKVVGGNAFVGAPVANTPAYKADPVYVGVAMGQEAPVSISVEPLLDSDFDDEDSIDDEED